MSRSCFKVICSLDLIFSPTVRDAYCGKCREILLLRIGATSKPQDHQCEALDCI